MARNYIQPGDTITWTNDGDVDVASGGGVVVDALFGVAKVDIAIGDSGELALVDVWELPKVSAQAWTMGQRIYWADGEATTTEDTNILIGVAIEAADNPSATGKVRLSAAFIGGGGGGGAPEPEIFADFSSETYQHNGDAVAVTDLFIGDEVNWGPFDPETAIIPGTGLRNVGNNVGYPSVQPSAIGTLASVGCSIVIEAFLVGNESAVALCADAPDWTQDIECTMRATPGKVQSYVNGVTQDATDNVAGSTLTKIGMTFLSDRTKFCIAGGTVDVDTFADAGARTFIAFTAPVDGYIKSIAIYAPLSDADLQSVTG